MFEFFKRKQQSLDKQVQDIKREVLSKKLSIAEKIIYENSINDRRSFSRRVELERRHAGTMENPEAV